MAYVVDSSIKIGMGGEAPVEANIGLYVLLGLVGVGALYFFTRKKR